MTDSSSAAVARDYRRYWFAGAADLLGSQASGLALPLLVLAVTADPVAAGTLATVSAVARFAVTPFAGVCADRYPRRSLMVGSALLAAAAAGAVVATVATGTVSWPLLLAAGVVEGFAAAGYTAGSSGAVRRLLPRTNPETAVARLRARNQGAELVGPSVGGALYQLTAWAPFLFDAITYLIAAGCIRSVRTDLGPDRGPHAPGAGSVWRELVAGARFVASHPFLRFVTIWAAGVNLALGALYFHVVLVARLAGASAGQIGLILTLSGAAGLAGALGTPWLLARVSAVRLVTITSWLLVAVVVLLALARTPWAFGAVLGAVSLVSPALSVVFQTRAIAVTPDRMQARAGTTLNTVGEGTASFAPLVAGLLVGTASPLVIAVVFGLALALLAAYATANRGALRPEPRPTDEPVPAAPGTAPRSPADRKV